MKKNQAPKPIIMMNTKTLRELRDIAINQQ